MDRVKGMLPAPQEWWHRVQSENNHTRLFRSPSFYREWVESQGISPEACYWFERSLSAWSQEPVYNGDNAIVYIQEALRHVDHEATGVRAYMYRWLGKAYWAAGEPSQALQAFRRAQILEYAPDIDLWLERCLQVIASPSRNGSH